MTRADLPKEWTGDPSITAKARAMCSRHGDQYISDYLGIPVPQVESIRRNRLIGTPRGRPRAPWTVEKTVHGGDYWNVDAIQGSAALARRINEVFGRRA